MSFAFKLKQFYFQSKFYLVFSLFQILVSIGLIGYVLIDFQHHFRNPKVLETEIVILVMMTFDIILNRVVNRSHLTIISLFEYFTIHCFVFTLLHILRHGISCRNEQLELFFMGFRFCLQVIRICIGYVRIKENRHLQNKTFQIHIEDIETGLDSSFQTEAEFANY